VPSRAQRSGFIDRTSNRLKLSARAYARLAKSRCALSSSNFATRPPWGGTHARWRAAAIEKRPPSRGSREAVALHLPRTLRNAPFVRGPAPPVKLHPDDFEVEEYEATRRSATVFAIDLSLSMAMRGNSYRRRKWCSPCPSSSRQSFPRLRRDRGLWRNGPAAEAGGHSALTSTTTRHQPSTRSGPQSAPVAQRARGTTDRVVTDGEPRPTSQPRASPFFWPRPRNPGKDHGRRCCAAPRPTSGSTPRSGH